MEKIAAVVVTYNRCELLMECIDRLTGQQGASCDILIVDNASTDGTMQAVSKVQSSRIQYRNTGANLGGAGGFQYGIRWAVQAGYEGIWLMDDDTFPDRDALSKLLEAHEILRGEYGFLSSAVLWKDGSGCKMNAPMIHRYYHEDMALLKDGLIRIDQATFVSMLLPAEVVRRAGLPIGEFFIWGDDVEYSRRISVRMKRPAYLVGNSRVTHMMSQNSGSDIARDSIERIPRYRNCFRNENYLYRQEGVRGIGFYLCKCLANMKNIILHARDHKWKRLFALVGGALAGIGFRPRVEFVADHAEDGVGEEKR